MTERVFVSGFVGIPVFRYEDTEGAELERPDYRPATFPPLYEVAERLGVGVDYLPFTERYRGYYRPGAERIVLCSHDESVFFHELAHAAHKRVNYGLDGHLYHGAEYIRGYANGKSPAKAAMRVLGDVQKVLELILGGDDA